MTASAFPWQGEVRDWRERIWRVVGGVSIRTKILGIVLLMVVFPGLVVTTQVRATLTSTLREQLYQESMAVARDVAARSTDLVLINDIYSLNRMLLETQQNNPDIRYLFLIGPDGQVLAHTFGDEFPLDLLQVNVATSEDTPHVQQLMSEEGIIWDTAMAVFGGRAGTVRVGLTEQRMWEVINSVIGQIILSILVVSIVGIGAASVLTWLLTRPIKELVVATQRVGQGDYSPRVARWADDEIGDLAEAFNDMVSRLGQAEAERAERERMRHYYLQRVIHAQEDERKRIARELHDETGQALASLMVGLRNLEGSHDPEVLHERLQDLRELLANTLERVRGLAFDLRPSVLDDMGLVAALRRYGQQCQQRYGFRVDVSAVGIDQVRLRPEAETSIYRIVQEALTNAAKYASCTQVDVLLQERDDQLVVIIEDNGCGFDVERVLAEQVGRRSLGLYGMQERVELLGGTIDIESEAGQGTSIYLRFPMSAVSLSEVAL
ncbi:MAG: HAMP domain-containing protein [Anaerolineae bacterium]